MLLEVILNKTVEVVFERDDFEELCWKKSLNSDAGSREQ